MITCTHRDADYCACRAQARNAMTRADPLEVLTDRDVSTATVHAFSTRVETEGKATSQARSGRCWLPVQTQRTKTRDYIYIIIHYTSRMFGLLFETRARPRARRPRRAVCSCARAAKCDDGTPRAGARIAC